MEKGSLVLNNFSKGLVTEYSDLNNDPSSFKVLENFNISPIGTLQKRFGLQPINTADTISRLHAVPASQSKNPDSYSVEPLTGHPNYFIHVDQESKTVWVSNFNGDRIYPLISDDYPGTRPEFENKNEGAKLAVAHNNKHIVVFTSNYYVIVFSNEFGWPGQVYRDTVRVRDFNGHYKAGLTTCPDNVDLSNYVPDPYSTHRDEASDWMYNYRIRGWWNKFNGTKLLYLFHDHYGEWPSYYDHPGLGYTEDPVTAKTVYKPELTREGVLGKTPAATGGEIRPIGGSLVTSYRNPSIYRIPIEDIPSVHSSESTNVGVAFYGNRVFYSVGNYVFFSQVITDNLKNIGDCYQANDPTSLEDYDILATDGGMFKIIEADRILKLKEESFGLTIYATNGIWRLSGAAEAFSAISIDVKKISDNSFTGTNLQVDTPYGLAYLDKNTVKLITTDNRGIKNEEILSDSVKDAFRGVWTKASIAYSKRLSKLYVASGYELLIFDMIKKSWVRHAFHGTLNIMKLIIDEQGSRSGSSVTGAGFEILDLVLVVQDKSKENHVNFYMMYNVEFFDYVGGSRYEYTASFQTWPMNFEAPTKRKLVENIHTVLKRIYFYSVMHSSNPVYIDSGLEIAVGWDRANDFEEIGDNHNRREWSLLKQAYKEDPYAVNMFNGDYGYYEYYETSVTSDLKFRGSGKTVTLYGISRERQACEVYGFELSVKQAKRKR